MIELITTSTKVLDLEHNGVCVEINTVETDEKLEMSLYAFRENPEENRMLLVKCHGLPKQKQEFMTTIYSIIDNPCEWMNRNLEA